MTSPQNGTAPPCFEDPDGLFLDGPVAAGEAGEYSNAQDSSNDKTSPAALVTDMGAQEKPSGSVVTVAVVVVVVVVTLLIVDVVVSVKAGMHAPCLACKMASFKCVGAGARARPEALAPLLVLGGEKERAQSVSSSSVAFSLPVTVIGGHTKLGASSGSDTSVIVVVLVVVEVEYSVSVSVTTAAGQSEHVPSSAQKALERQHSVSQHVSSFGQLPLSQHTSVAGS